MNESTEEIEEATAEVLDAMEDDAPAAEEAAEATEGEESEESGEGEEPSEEPGIDPAIEALSMRIDELEADIALIRDSISSLVESGMVIHEEAAEDAELSDDDIDALLLEDLDYS